MKIWTAWFSELAFCLQQVKNTLWNKILHRVSLKGQAVFLFPLNATSESHNGHCSAGTAPMAHLMARVTKSRQEWFEYDFIPKEMKVWKECPGRREESVLQWNVWTEALLQGAPTLGRPLSSNSIRSQRISCEEVPFFRHLGHITGGTDTTTISRRG